MAGYRKLALIAAAAVVWIGAEVQAATISPFTTPSFIAYMYKGNSSWAHGAGFLMHFVHWRSDNPEWTVKNVSWVEKWGGDGGDLHKPDMIRDPDTGQIVDDSIPPWKREATIPEPGTALLVGGLMSIMALRRRAM